MKTFCYLGILVFVLASSLVTASVEATISSNDEKQNISQQLDGFHSAAGNAQFETYFAHFTDSAVFIGTDASERWPVEEFRAFVEPYFNKGQGWLYVPRDRHIIVEGKVAWFDELLDSESYGECRGSGVLLKQDGRWKIAQYNLHFPIPNDLAKSITTMIRNHQAE
ncbi:MAG: nuclear transport factor 2 family protein [Pseudomonadales bacterium]